MENLNLDATFLALVGRTQMAYFMITVDMISAGIMVYIAVAVSRYFGFGNFEQRLQAAHRISMLFVAFLFGWHAEDIAVNPIAHGLTPVNLFLHIAFVIVIAISALRLHRASRNEEELKHGREIGNGGAMTGPFPFRH